MHTHTHFESVLYQFCRVRMHVYRLNRSACVALFSRRTQTQCECEFLDCYTYSLTESSSSSSLPSTISLCSSLFEWTTHYYECAHVCVCVNRSNIYQTYVCICELGYCERNNNIQHPFQPNEYITYAYVNYTNKHANTHAHTIDTCQHVDFCIVDIA